MHQNQIEGIPYPSVYFYDLELGREIAQASGASIFLHQTMIPGQSNSTVYLYCDQFLSELKFDPPDESELCNGIFKYLEPYLD